MRVDAHTLVLIWESLTSLPRIPARSRRSRSVGSERSVRCTTHVHGDASRRDDRVKIAMNRSLRTLAVGVAIATTTAVSAKEPVSIRVNPTVGIAPADVNIRITVEPNASNRGLEIVADSDSFFRSSLVQLDGDRAPVTTTIRLRGLPGGNYAVTAVVIGANGQQRAIARAQVNIVGAAGIDSGQ